MIGDRGERGERQGGEELLTIFQPAAETCHQLFVSRNQQLWEAEDDDAAGDDEDLLQEHLLSLHHLARRL